MFEDMSFGEAVAYVQTVGGLSALLLWVLPITAFVSLRTMRRNGCASRTLFPKVVLGLWALQFLIMIGALLTGAWYSESGPPPQVAAVQATWAFLILLALHIALAVAPTWRRGSGAAAN